ncbi:hypothetical protein OC844_007827, partial [Tilletia horrida]
EDDRRARGGRAGGGRPAAAKDAALAQAAKDALATAIAKDAKPGDPSSISATAATSSSTAPAPAALPSSSPRRGHPAPARQRPADPPLRRVRQGPALTSAGARAASGAMQGAASAGVQNDFMRALAKAGQDHRDALAKADTAGSAGAGGEAGRRGRAEAEASSSGGVQPYFASTQLIASILAD